EILVRVETASGRSGEQSIGAPKEPPAPRDFVLEEPVTISGLVVDAESERQLAGARVWLRDTPSAFTDTDRYGKFHLVTAAAAWQRSWLRATRPGYLRSIARPRPRRSAKPATLPSPLELQPADTLFGRIVDAQGEPIDGAKILLQASQQIPHTTRSQPDGRFKAPAIGNVVYQIRVSKTAYLDEQREASVDDGPVDRGIRVVLRQGLEGFGRVVDRAGEPIDGAQVSLLTPDEAAQAHRGPGASHGPLTQQTTTDAAGRFELSNMQPGVLVDLEVTAPGYGTTHGGRREMVETSEAIDFGTVIMEPGHELRIQVVDPQGQPLPEASVSTEPWPARRAWQSPAETKTTADGEGRCILRDFAAGDKITVTAHHPAYTKQRLPGLEISHPEILTLVLEPKGKIAGLVVDDHGEPQPAASVSVLHQDGSGGFGTSHQADGEGRFEIEIDAADQLSLTARAADRRSDNLTLSLAPGQVVEDLRLVLAAGESLEGRVLDPSGEPLAQAYVRISGMDAQMFLAVRQRRTARTDRDGRFAFTGLTPGVVLLRVHSQGLPSAQQTIDLQPGVNRLEIRLPRPHQVHGRVVDAAGRPIGDAQVSLRSIDQNLGGSATSAADGSFT
ncbi:MAG: carboxypeptidase-like regulatory domain-containing protein, partial [Acidobacteriota bacterium]